jgi:hypothetical protein
MQFQRLIRSVPLHCLSMIEFEVYIRALQQRDSTKNYSKQRQSRRQTQQPEQASNFSSSCGRKAGTLFLDGST